MKLNMNTTQMTIPQYILDKTKTKLEWKDYFNSEYVLHSYNNNITSTPINNAVTIKPCCHYNIAKAFSFSYLHNNITTQQQHQPLVINHFHVELNNNKQIIPNDLYLNTNNNEHIASSTYSNNNTICNYKSKRKVLKYENFTEIFKTALTDRDYHIVMLPNDNNNNNEHKSNNDTTNRFVGNNINIKYKKFNNYYNQLHKAKEESRKKLFNPHYSHRMRLHTNNILK